jgi:D-alanine-D-alanine ligase
MDKKKVILLADIHDSLPDLNSAFKQEWESRESIQFLMDTILKLEYEVILLEPKKSKLKILDILKDIVGSDSISDFILFNLVEGFSSRNREGYIPSLAEFFGIPFAGSDAYSQAISLDKNLMKSIVKKLNIPTRSSFLITDIHDLPFILNYPVFIKPNAEGSSLGISKSNLVHNLKELKVKGSELLENFDSFLIEDYLAGEDLTLGVVGNFPNYEVTSVAKVSYPDLVYSEEIKTKESMPEKLSFSIQKSLEEKIQSDTIKICKKLKVTGYARLDWKCDALGNPFFLELNLTPGLSAYYSSLPICYLETLGNYSDLIKKVLQFGYENYNTNKIFNYGRL